MGGVVGVAQGSERPPKFLIGEYNPDAKKQIALIGKGVLFDSGGLSLKSPSGMETMKTDMAGAATAWGIIALVAKQGLDIGLKVYTPIVENMPSGTATKPGDVVSTMSGQTVEILNTDAEGRLVLCDALTYVERFKPASVIDIATLTGAVIVALGHEATGVMSNDQKLADKILSSGIASGDKAWQLPLWDEYKSCTKTNFADLANIGGAGAGTVTAACFLSKFTEDYSWAHLDIAGMAFSKYGGALNSGGATGQPPGDALTAMQSRWGARA